MRLQRQELARLRLLRLWQKTALPQPTQAAFRWRDNIWSIREMTGASPMFARVFA
jgi:hypothetical protein